MEITIKPAEIFNSNPKQGKLHKVLTVLNNEFNTDFSVNLDTINDELIFTEE